MVKCPVVVDRNILVVVVVCRPVEEKRKPRPDAPSANRKLTSNMAAKRTP